MNIGDLRMKPALIALLAAGALGSVVNAVRASVQVHGEATSTGPSIRLQLFADITRPAIVSHSFKLFYPARELTVAAATHNDAVWYFHDGTRTVPCPAPDTSNAGEVMFVGGHLDGR